MTNDLNYIFVGGYNPIIDIYKYNGNEYVWHQNLTEMANSIIDISMTNNSEYMGCGGHEGKVRIYQNNGTGFNMKY